MLAKLSRKVNVTAAKLKKIQENRKIQIWKTSRSKYGNHYVGTKSSLNNDMSNQIVLS